MRQRYEVARGEKPKAPTIIPPQGRRRSPPRLFLRTVCLYPPLRGRRPTGVVSRWLRCVVCRALRGGLGRVVALRSVRSGAVRGVAECAWCALRPVAERQRP